MNYEKLGKKDYFTILVCVLIFSVSLFIGISYFDNAFPESSIEFKYNRQETEPMAHDYLKSLDLIPPGDYRHASIFSYDGLAKVQLEKELGLDSAQHYFGEPVRLWKWRHRWFKPSTKEEFRASVTPLGEIVHFDHLIDEDAEGAELTQDSAQVIADTFLFGRMGVDSTTVELLEASEVGRPNRSDWYIIYKLKDFEPLPDTNYRYRITIQGDKVGGYNEYLHVPEAWRDDYSKLRSLNNLAGGVASFFSILTIIAIVYVFVAKIRKKDIHWKTAIIFGIVAAALVYLNQLNGLPNTLYGYDTKASWSGFLMEELFMGLLMALGAGVLIAFLTASAESIFREMHPDKPSLPKMFTVQGLRTKRAFINIIVGVTMTGFFFAYQAVFYMVSSKLGAWSPADVPYSNLLNTAMPWVAVLMIGFMPAVSEEFMSRMFSIPFLQKLFKGKFIWLAVFIPSIIWGFGHAAYPNQPFWIRGAEVGIAGLIISVVFLRFGILGPLVWHYTVDALYTAFLLFGSDNIYFIVTAGVGAGLLVIPLLILLIAYLKTGHFLPETGLLNKDIVAEKDSLEVTPEITEEIKPEKLGTLEYSPIPVKVKIAVLIVLALAFFIAPTHRLGDFKKYPVSKQEAIATFKDSLRAIGWADPDTMIIGGYAGGSDNADLSASSPSYLLKELNSIEKFNDLYEHTLGSGSWGVRAWTHGNRLRFAGTVDAQTGDIQGMSVLMPEKMVGDSLTKDSAQVLIEKAFADVGIDLSNLILESHWEDNHPNRIDHFFIYEAPKDDERHIGEALFRYTGSVTGDYISVHKYPYYKIPEEWVRERKAKTGLRMVHMILYILAIASFIAYGITLLILRTRKGLVPWKKAALYAIPPALIGLLSIPNLIYNMNNSYFSNPVIEWKIFASSMIIGTSIIYIFMYIFMFVSIALILSLYPEKKNELFGVPPSKMKFDLFISFTAAIALMLFMKNVTGWLDYALPTWIPLKGGTPSWIGYPFISGQLLSGLPRDIITFLVGISLFLFLWEKVKPLGFKLLIILGVFLFLQMAGGAEPKEWVFVFIKSIALVGSFWVLLKFIVRGRPLLLITAIFAYALLPDFANGVFGLGNTNAMINSIIFGVIALILYFVFLYFIEKKAKQS